MKFLGAALLFALAAASAAAAAQQSNPWPARRIPVLVLTGENNHDWRWTSTALFHLLESSGKFEVEVEILPAAALEDTYRLSQYEVIVLDYNGERWGEAAERNFLEAVKGGTGVVVLHASNNAFPGWKEYEQLVGHLWRDGTGHGSFHPFDVRIDNREHPLTRGLPDLKAHPDELYHGLVNPHEAEHTVLATAYSDASTGGIGQRVPVLFAGAFGKGRIAHTALGHVWWNDDNSRNSYRDEAFQRLVVRMVEWAATGGTTPLQRQLPNTLTPADRAAGWKLLFDGQTTNGWHRLGEGMPPERWQVEGGALRLLPGDSDGDIVATEEYEEFELELEWRMERDDEGAEFHYRVSPDGSLMWRTALDLRLAEEAGEEVPYDLQPAEGVVLRPAGEFNHVRIVARRDRVEHWLNGIQILELPITAAQWAAGVQGENFAQNPELEQLPLGHVILSGAGKDVWFRNIKIRRPPPEQVPVSEVRPTVLFEDPDAPEWERYWRVEGETADAFSRDVEEGLVVTGAPIGYLRTKEACADYRLELEWRYHPITRQTGEGGILFGIGDTDDIWPYGMELRFEYPYSGDLWAHFDYPHEPEYPRTNGRQTTRLADADRNPGDWNECSVEVRGDTVTVHLNGVLVNQLSGLPGTPGRIAIKSSGTEVHYRNVRLTSLAR